jgi:hypothetical protein
LAGAASYSGMPILRSDRFHQSALEHFHLEVRCPSQDFIVPKGGSTVCLRTRILPGPIKPRLHGL